MVGASLLVASIMGCLPLVPVKTIAAPTTILVAVEKPKPPVQQIPAILKPISGCESWGNPSKLGTQWADANGDPTYENTGRVLRGPDGHDIGMFQIRETVHAADAKKLGMDIYTESGNRAYALILYKRNGTRDWNASSHCWGS